MTPLEYAWGRMLFELMQFGAGVLIFILVFGIGWLLIILGNRK